MRLRAVVCVAVIVVSALSGCAARPASRPFQRVRDASASGQWRSRGDDRFEVWICRVPVDSVAPIYGRLPLRRPLTPGGVAALVAATVTPYFEDVSHGVYRPKFVAGGEVTMAADDGPQACIDQAISRSGADTRAVLVVADAEHAPDQQGGFASAGVPGAAQGPVALTHRAAYVGASDFNPTWGDRPPMDLVEHEVGHTLGWVHSGTAPGPPERYLSALDVMSDSAAPRAVDPAVRDAPDTLAIDRVISGWLTGSSIRVANGSTTTRLVSSTGDTGERLLVLPVGDTSFLTVEFLSATGHDAHVPRSGIAVHRVQVTTSNTDTTTSTTTNTTTIMTTIMSFCPNMNRLNFAPSHCRRWRMATSSFR